MISPRLKWRSTATLAIRDSSSGLRILKYGILRSSSISMGMITSFARILCLCNDATPLYVHQYEYTLYAPDMHEFTTLVKIATIIAAYAAQIPHTQNWCVDHIQF